MLPPSRLVQIESGFINADHICIFPPHVGRTMMMTTTDEEIDAPINQRRHTRRGDWLHADFLCKQSTRAAGRNRKNKLQTVLEIFEDKSTEGSVHEFESKVGTLICCSTEVDRTIFLGGHGTAGTFLFALLNL